MKGVSFLGFHSYDDLHLLLTEKEIGSPEVKRQTIDIEGADGELDFTDFFGEPKYANVQHRFSFETIRPRNEQLSQYTDIKNKIHGKKGRIILDDDPSFFYVGRCYVSAYKNENVIGRISIECDCEPYKYKVDKTVHLVSLSGKNLFDASHPTVHFASGAKAIEIDNGLRIETTENGAYRYIAFRVAPSKIFEGKTVSFSCIPTASIGNTPVPTVYIGYVDVGKSFVVDQANPLNRSVKMTVDSEKTKEYGYLAIWLYANTNGAVEIGTYVEYTNMQLEIDDSGTEYEPYNSTGKTITVNVQNSRKAVTPVLYSSKPVTVTRNGYTLAMSAETEYTVPEFELKEGNNEFTITGSGLVSFTYQEGSL